jgi:hypothetical protein
MRQKKLARVLIAKPVSGFCKYAAGRNPTREIRGGEGLRRPFRVTSEFKSFKRAR